MSFSLSYSTYHCFFHFKFYISHLQNSLYYISNVGISLLLPVVTITWPSSFSSSSSLSWLLLSFFASFPVVHLSKWIIHIRMCWMSLATVFSDGIAVMSSFWFVLWKFKYRNQIGYNGQLDVLCYHFSVLPSYVHPYTLHNYIQYNRLHAKYVAGILKEATIRLKRLPNLNQASTAISKQVTILGDLHGKLDDLLVVFHKVSESCSMYFTCLV